MLKALNLKKIAIALTMVITLLGCGKQNQPPVSPLTTGPNPTEFSPSDIYGSWRLTHVNATQDGQTERVSASDDRVDALREIEVNSDGISSEALRRVFHTCSTDWGQNLVTFTGRNDENQEVNAEFQIRRVDNQLHLIIQNTETQNRGEIVTFIYERVVSSPSPAPLGLGRRGDGEFTPSEVSVPSSVAPRRLLEAYSSDAYESVEEHHADESVGEHARPSRRRSMILVGPSS